MPCAALPVYRRRSGEIRASEGPRALSPPGRRIRRAVWRARCWLASARRFAAREVTAEGCPSGSWLSAAQAAVPEKSLPLRAPLTLAFGLTPGLRNPGPFLWRGRRGRHETHRRDRPWPASPPPANAAALRPSPTMRRQGRIGSLATPNGLELRPCIGWPGPRGCGGVEVGGRGR
jgi:hypothetical protein